jgi:heme/copper-type cytochrome/quinol oxidase subunit 4
MTTYVLSEHVRNTYQATHRMSAGQAHPRAAHAARSASRWLGVLVAFVLAATALSAGFLLLTGQGISLMTTAPALLLLSLAGMLYTLMLFLFFSLKFG